MTPSRIAALAAIVLGVIVLVFVGMRGGKADNYTLVFDDAGGLIKGNLLRVNGINMGKVTDIGVTKDLKAKIGIEVTELGPLREGTFAQIRATSLGGVANKYIALQLGPNNSPNIPEDAVIGTAHTRGITGQDEFVNAFDPETRKGLKQIVKGLAQVSDGNSENLQKALTNAPGSLGELKDFAGDLNPDSDSLRDVVVQSATISNALADHTAAIADLSRQTAIADKALAGNGTEIAQSIAGSPSALDEANQTLEQIPGTLTKVQRLLLKADSVKAGVPEMLRQLSDTLDSGSPTIAALARTLNSPGPNNDAADLLAAAPAVGKAATKASQTVPAGLAAATPLLSKTRAYTPDLTSAITSLGLISANYDAAGNYLRLEPVINLFQAQGTNPNQDLIPRSSLNNRLQGFGTTTNRCPGAATQRPADGSAPYTDGGKISCNTADMLP